MKKMVVAMLAGTMLLSSGLQASAAGLRDVFDAEYYANSYKDLKEAFGTDEEALYQHFLEYGLKEGRIMNPIIDVAAYRNKYEDLDKAFGDNWDAYIDHYFTYGVNENRDNGTDFDLKKYKAAYEDLREELGEEDNFLYAKHYLEFGQDENRVKGNKSYEEPKPAASQEEVVAPVVPDSGNVKYEYDESGKVIKQTFYNENGSSWAQEYDANGNSIKETSYDKDGNVTWTNTIEYDANGNKSTVKGYDAEGKLYLTLTYNYGTDGKLESEKTVYSAGDYNVRVYGDDGRPSYTEYYNADGSSYTNEYNDNGKTVRINYYDAEGTLTYYDVYEYDENGQRSKWLIYLGDGTLVRFWEYKYVDGVEREATRYEGDGTFGQRNVYERDENGQITQTTSYGPTGAYSVSKTVGNVFFYTSYDADGKFLCHSETEYDDDGNPINMKDYDESGNVIAEYDPVYNEEYGYYTWVKKEA